MNFNLRKELQQNRDADPVSGTPFTREQEERLRELIREEVVKVLGSETSAARTRIGIGVEHSEMSLEQALERAAEKAGAISVRKLHQLMQESADSAAKEIKQRSFVRKNVCNGAVDYVIPDATGLVCVVAKPVPLAERRPDDSEKDESSRCYYGEWYCGSWQWTFGSVEGKWSTHFLPAGIEALPATCFNPTERENDRV